MNVPSSILVESIRDVTIVAINDKAIVRPDRIAEIGQALFDEIDKHSARKLIVDMTKVQQIAPSAISIFMELKKRSDEIRGQVVLVGVQPEPRKVFKLAGLQKLFKFYADEEGGLRAFGMTTAG